ncbi:MAG: SRPBCC family protein [Anaerolineales bacterium]|nr:SRPBCC family protein [Anaerolineales bacterium]
MIHRLTRTQTVPAPIDQVWDYFSKPGNLNELTPPDMHFKIVDNDAEEMHPGQLIEYRVRFMPVIQSRWLTEIAHVQHQVYFVDEQRIGPYRFWYHEHRFVEVPSGTQISDRVTYELPFGPLGDLVHTIWVRQRLQGIFDYRTEKIKQLFGSI